MDCYTYIIILACILLVATPAIGDLNPYKVLGVDRRSGLDEIKRAYKQLALQYHPDRNRDASASEQFILVNEAYQILSSQETRRLYDLFGYAHVSNIRTNGLGSKASRKQQHRRVPEAGTYFYSTTNSSSTTGSDYYENDENDNNSNDDGDNDAAAASDENQQYLHDKKSAMRRIHDRMSRVRDKLSDSLRKRDVLPVVSVLGTITFLLMLGFLLSYFDPVSIEKRRRRRQQQQQLGTSGAVNASSGLLCGGTTQSNEIRVVHKDRLVHELKPQTYAALVRNLKPGHRSLIILVDVQTRDKLVQRFGDIVYPYRKNKSLQFAYLNVDIPERLDWYRRLLQQTLVMMDGRRLQLIPRKCSGTVLSLNGFRRHYSIYHAMHRDSQPRRHRRRRLQRDRRRQSVDDIDEFDDDDDDFDTEDEDDSVEHDASYDAEWHANNTAALVHAPALEAAPVAAIATAAVSSCETRRTSAARSVLSTGSSQATTVAVADDVYDEITIEDAVVNNNNNNNKPNANTTTPHRASAGGSNNSMSVITTPAESDPPSYEELVKRNIIDATSADYLLAGLSAWLDRLFDGKLQNYYISTWPILK